VAVMTCGVLGAGLFWGWLRRRTGAVWPALLSHGGAVIAYLAVHVWLTGRL
jgi:membrane protease YdiL (CAAX protease family)